jgi:biotin operon repressor
VARQLGRGRSTVHRHVQRLRQIQALKVQPAGRSLALFSTGPSGIPRRSGG